MAFVVCFLQAAAASAQLTISEFRVRGPSGANDEFIEIYNASGVNHTVSSSSGTGYGIAASDGVARCTIPNGTIIPARGHYLCVNSVAYSLASYPAGNGTTATGDATYIDGHSRQRGHRALQQQLGRRQLYPRQPARRRRLHLRSQHALQGRDRLSGADPVQHRLLLHAPAGRRLHRLGRGHQLQQRVAHPDDAWPDHFGGAGHPATTRATSCSSTPTAPAPAPASGWARPAPRT